MLVLVSLLLAAVPAHGAQTDQSVVSGCHSVDAAVALSDDGQIAETAKAAIVYELTSDTMIYAWNPDIRIYPSSMVKLMTALVALENGNLEDKVVVTKRALSYVAVGSVSAKLVAGEELTLEDLLYCLMTASANDAAAVIAEHIGGTQDKFIKMMNDRAAELGCTGTNYTNVHGLHDEGMYTTARDICRLLDYALDNPVFKEMFSAVSYTVPATNKSEEREIVTSNDMMNPDKRKYYDERVTGGKTGATDEAGRCLAATAQSGSMELLTIVMGAEPIYEENGISLIRFGSFEETEVLLDYTVEKYAFRQVFFEGQTINQIPVENGENSVVTRPAKTASTVLPVELDETRLTWIYGETAGVISAPVAEGQVISSVQVWYGAKCLAQADLVAANAVNVYTPPVAPTEPEGGADGKIGRVVGMAAAAVLGAAVVFVLIRAGSKWLLKLKRNARRRRRRVDRRRSR